MAMDNRSVRVLLVDDDEDDYILTRDLLAQSQETQFELEWVFQFNAALEVMHHNRHDIYLLDYRLGERNGLELLQQAIANGCRVPMILLTGRGDRAIDLAAMKAGAADFLDKSQLRAPLLERSIRYALERHRAEQKIREQAALLDVTTDAILVQNLDGQITFCNKAAQQIYGWSAEEVLGKNANTLFYPAESSSHLQDIQIAVALNGNWYGELHQIGKDKKKILVESRWTLVQQDEEKPRSILIVNTDITEKKRLESQFLRAQRMESIGTLAGGIAHDLNNVLTPILMVVQLLALKLQDKQGQQWLNILETNAKRGADLVKQVVSFARGVEGERTLVQVRHLIGEIKQIARETFPKFINVYTDIPQDLWTVSGDATQLHQVLMNLCVNARDAMPDGGTLSISAKNVFIDENYAWMNVDAKVGSYIAITVSDTGTGIPPEILERIFEPFFTTKELGKGTGLGLSTVIGIIKSHGGFVNVYSEPGQGTAFKVYLPAVEEIQAPFVRETKLPSGHGELILLVDDEMAIQKIVQTSLETYDYKVLTASDGVEAIALYAQHKQEISAVLIDMMMPTMDGLTTIHMLQRMSPQVKIIAISGLALSDKVGVAMEAGVQAFLSKPFTAEELLQTLSGILSSCS
jgi:two-component system, cell cycle sensor histidine kinase and response regulator CckA